jgi:hypothetical protein
MAQNVENNCLMRNQVLMTNKLQIEGNDPIKTSPVVDFKGLGVPMKSRLLEVHLRLADGTELYLPLKRRALDKMVEQMADLYRRSRSGHRKS